MLLFHFPLGSLAFADPQDNSYTLEKLILCMDNDSVNIQADTNMLQHLPNIDQTLYSHLIKQLNDVLSNSSVKLIFQATCQGSKAYTLLTLSLYSLDPEMYKEFPQGSTSYTLYLQVGQYATKDVMASQYTFPVAHFLSFTEDIYTPQQNVSLVEELSKVSTTQSLELAKAWWDDNPKLSWWYYAPYIIGSFLVIAIVSAAILKQRLTTPSKQNQ